MVETAKIIQAVCYILSRIGKANMKPKNHNTRMRPYEMSRDIAEICIKGYK